MSSAAGILTGGLLSPRLPAQGYGIGDVAITINPVSATVAINGTVNFTASVPANWSTTCGSLVVASNHLSAVYTAPGSPGSCTVTVIDRTDSGNRTSAHVRVLATPPGGGGGGFVFADGAGNLTDSRKPGAYGGAASSPAPPSPVLLTGLIGWALTAGPQQTLSSAGVIASGPLDLTENGDASIVYDASGAHFVDPHGQYLSHAANAAFAGGNSDYTLAIVATPGQSPLFGDNAAQIGIFDALAPGSEQYYLSFLTFFGGASDCFAIFQPDNSNNDDIRTEAGTIVQATRYSILAWLDTTLGTFNIRMNGGAAVSFSYPGTIVAAANSAFSIGANNGGSTGDLAVRYARRWNRVLTNTEQLFVMNGSVGRTDAEIAAYTGA